MKTIKLLVVIVLVILILPLFGYFGWLLKKGVPLELVVVNKTYRQFQGSENESLNYILNENKIYTSGSRTYDLSVDHIGLHWNRNDYLVKYPRLKDIDRLVEKTDFVYYADVAGLYESDIRKLKKDEEDALVYGGLNNTDYLLIKKFIENKTPLVVESSFFESPTEELVRYNIEKLTNVYYLGWLGIYIQNLAMVPDKEEGVNWQDIYTASSGKSWDYTGQGIVMINLANNTVLVLEEGEDIQTSEGLIVTDESYVDIFGVARQVNYHGWFSVLHQGDNEVVSEFQLNPTVNGMNKLNAAGLDATFPALIRAEDNFYFMAGDFGKNTINGMLTKVLLFNRLKDAALRGGKSSDQFFFSYYHPFMRHLLEQVGEMKVEIQSE